MFFAAIWATERFDTLLSSSSTQYDVSQQSWLEEKLYGAPVLILHKTAQHYFGWLVWKTALRQEHGSKGKGGCSPAPSMPGLSCGPAH